MNLAERMISSWTVEMNYQAFNEYREVCELAGLPDKAAMLEQICESIRSDFNKHLIKDGIVAGYGLLEADGNINVLLHPSDRVTGIHYSLLPMNRGVISGIFTKEQAEHHQQLIEQHLKGPDGARLMDRPLKYKGGIQTIFQRAESSTFFGREIGLMYIHEHLRYVEALSLTGKAEEFVHAMRQAIPTAYQEIVPCGETRQSNCYYSSSDVVFKSRYEADQRYDEIKTGSITLKGGWRVYSSGPGVFIGILISRLLGIKTENGHLIIDPVMPFSFDGLVVRLDYLGKNIRWFYHVKQNNAGPHMILCNGKEIASQPVVNKYRRGGVKISLPDIEKMLDNPENTIEVFI
jgi:1,2-beta-oligoglucan phosphorylase